MNYQEFLTVLQGYAEKDFADFQRKLIPTSQTILGVRTPTLRKLAKQYTPFFKDIFELPDSIYEVTFIKLAQVSALPYNTFILYVEDCVEKIDNWSTCDTFKAKYLYKNREEFLPIIKRLFDSGEEFKQRYALVTLLSYYMDEPYLPLIEEYVFRVDYSLYYVHMAVAWLVAELLIKYYDFGVKLLQKQRLPKKTQNKAIQKAIESFRLDNKEKEFLRALRN